MHHRVFLKHCSDAHGNYAEYRKRLLSRAQQHWYKPLLPWVQQHILQATTLHLTHSLSSGWNHPEATVMARKRCEVVCMVCAGMDWPENWFSVYLYRESTSKQSFTELLHVDSGASELLSVDTFASAAAH